MRKRPSFSLRAHELDKARPDASADGGPNRAEKAHLSLLLGRAFLGLSRYADCRTHNESGPEAGRISRAGEFARRRARSAEANRQTGPLAILAVGPRNARLREGPSARGGSRLRGVGRDLLFFGDTLRTLYAAMSTLNLSERLGPSAGTCPRLRDAVWNHRIFPVAQGLGPLFGASVGNSSQS